MAAHILTALQAASCLYVLFICVAALNAMGLYTRHMMRAAYLLLATGSLAGIHSAISQPSVANSVLALGVALFLACNARRQNANRTA